MQSKYRCRKVSRHGTLKLSTVQKGQLELTILSATNLYLFSIRAPTGSELLHSWYAKTRTSIGRYVLVHQDKIRFLQSFSKAGIGRPQVSMNLLTNAVAFCFSSILFGAPCLLSILRNFFAPLVFLDRNSVMPIELPSESTLSLYLTSA